MRTKNFPSLLALLQAHFQGHHVFQSGDKYFIDTEEEANEIYLPDYSRREIRFSYPFKILRLKIARALARHQQEHKGYSLDDVVQTLQDLTHTSHRFFAPSFHYCPKCGYINEEAGHSYEHNARGLSGHNGGILVCALCGRDLGLDPDSLHSFS